MPRLLSDSEVDERLKKLKGWKHEGNFIVKAFEFEDFMEAIDFVHQVALVAEKEEHHPDINVVYTTVTLSIQTHSEGGITKWDLDLAEAVERSSQSRTRAR
jgi:4a-hydroxytetrahydrobiopterin dehydratase